MISAFISIKDHLEFQNSTLTTISMIIDLGWTKHKPSWKNLKLKITTQKINKNGENKTRSSQLFGWLSAGLVDRGLSEGNGWHFSVDSFCLTVCPKTQSFGSPENYQTRPFIGITWEVNVGQLFLRYMLGLNLNISQWFSIHLNEPSRRCSPTHGVHALDCKPCRYHVDPKL